MKAKEGKTKWGTSRKMIKIKEEEEEEQEVRTGSGCRSCFQQLRPMNMNVIDGSTMYTCAGGTVTH